MTRRSWLTALSAAPLLAQPADKVIDSHSHLSNPEQDRRMMDAADRLGIDVLCCSTLPPERPMSLDGCRQSNTHTHQAMQRFKGRVLGYCTTNPGYGKAALHEIRRCVEDRGFMGIKLYNDYRITEPVLDPLIELSIELRIPILQHGGHTTWLPSPQPRISDAAHIAEKARRYPEAMIICAHVCGGGDWEWTIKTLRHASTVYLDTSGSVIDAGVIDMAVATIGAQRLLFGCDMSMTASVGRMRAASLADSERSLILGGNMQRILDRRSRA